MTVSHHVENESTSRLYGSSVAPPVTLTLPIVKFSRCQTRNSRIVMPPQRMVREESDEARLRFTAYAVVRAACDRRQRITAQATCTTSAPSNATRLIQRNPP